MFFSGQSTKTGGGLNPPPPFKEKLTKKHTKYENHLFLCVSDFIGSTSIPFTDRSTNVIIRIVFMILKNANFLKYIISDLPSPTHRLESRTKKRRKNVSLTEILNNLKIFFNSIILKKYSYIPNFIWHFPQFPTNSKKLKIASKKNIKG